MHERLRALRPFQSQTSSRSQGGQPAGLVVATMIIAVAIFSWWMKSSLAPSVDLDNSWEMGLSLAVARGLAFGRQIVFTYGPLGLVAAPRAVTGGTLALGLLGALTIWVALAAVVLHALRLRCSWPVAALIAIVGLNIVAASISIEPPLVELAFGLVAIALAHPPERAAQAARTLALAGGVLAGLALLVKLNDGLGVSAIIAVGLLGGAKPGRNLTVGLLAFVLSALVAWLAMGQPIGALPDYLRTALSVVRGYVDAMGYNLRRSGGQWEIWGLVLSALALSFAAWQSISEASLRRRAALVSCVLLVHYFVAREMLVRYEPGRAGGIALLLVVALTIPWRRRQLILGSGMTIALAAGSLAALGTAGVGLGSVMDPMGRASALVSDIEVMSSPDDTIEQARESIMKADAVPPRVVAALDHHCVNVEPVEISVIFAYPSWRWCPVGVLQSYTAYTTELDELGAAAYANALTGPDRVLREVIAIDGRNPRWESPAALLSLLCHFREIARGSRWQALARIPNRCGRPRLLETLHGGRRNALPIPPAPPGDVLVARVQGMQITTRERVETLIARAPARTLILNGAFVYRVAPDTLADGLILDVPPDADYPAPFNLGFGVGSIAPRVGSTYVGKGGWRRDGVQAPFSVTLLAVPIKRTSAAGG
jgi:hypothetical protein